MFQSSPSRVVRAKNMAGLHRLIGADCIALDDGVMMRNGLRDNVATWGCVQGNLASRGTW